MNFKKIWFFTIALMMGIQSFNYAQNATDLIVQQIIEDLMEDQSEDFDFSELTERLNFYRKNPIEINRITTDQLKELFFLNPIQINSFIDHRKENGNFIDLLELQGLDGFDKETVSRFINFVYLGLPNSLQAIRLKNLYLQGTNDLMIRYSQYLQKQNGYLKIPGFNLAKYSGSPQRLLIRYRYYYGQNVSATLNLEKDPGESLFPAEKSMGFDFSSANIFVKNMGYVKKAVIGDYSLQFGQGLALWTGLSFGKGAMISNVAKPYLGLQPYKSTNEALFLRGIATTIWIKKLELTPFLSIKKMDASLNLLNDRLEVESMSQSGLHRTQNEILDKQSLGHNLYGVNINFPGNHLNIGLTAYQSAFSNYVQNGQLLYNQFRFSGKRLSNVGLNYSYTFKNTYFFGETAYSKSSIQSLAFVNGLMSSLSPGVSLVILHRRYPESYHSLFNQAVAESSNAVNENGLYTGLILKPIRKWELALYSDFFRFPWLKFGVDAPSSGHEIFGQLSYTVNKQTKYIFRYKLEQKQENDDLENPINILNDVLKQSYRFEFTSKVNKFLTIRNRLEIMDYKKENLAAELGWMIYQDVIYDPMKSKYSGNMRLAYFNTPGFNSRIYAYENDVLYSYSVPAYQNHGIRFYLNGRLILSDKIDLWVRYSLSKYSSLNIIGSGNEQINGSSRSEMKLQLRCQF
ncbi:MAG: helix-hairpin-helix domain-containing protein [Flavobacterium sp.]|nr:helix-hairpin-helix domain-containing protein [Pedobacter sp.]